MRKFLYGAVLAALLALVCGASAQATPAPAKRKHTIKTSMKPFKRVGRGAKALGAKLVNTTASTAGFSFLAFDAAVIDPLGVALQAFADGVDMFIAQPLEALPKPFYYVGEAVSYVYVGVDKVGEILAR